MEDWLALTRELQEGSFGFSLPLTGEELANYLTWNVAALTVELGEAMQEVGWKPWASERGWVNREQFVTELIDVAHFLANMAVAVGVTDAEWDRRYREKQRLNAARQEEGYAGDRHRR